MRYGSQTMGQISIGLAVVYEHSLTTLMLCLFFFFTGVLQRWYVGSSLRGKENRTHTWYRR